MNKKMLLRILGALSSALIIVSVFLPYISVTGYSQSIWSGYEGINSLYLPVMIIIFGVIGVIFFALNIKTEFAYMTAGAVGFYVIMDSINRISQNGFNTFGIAYYLIAIGTIGTAIVAFLSNLKPKINQEPVQQLNVLEGNNSILNKIDNLYNDQTQNMNQLPINNMTELPVQPISSNVTDVVSNIPIPEVMPVPEVSPISPVSDVTPMLQVNPVQDMMQDISPVSDVTPMPQVNPVQDMMQDISPVSDVAPIQEQKVNPVVQGFATVTEFNNNQFMSTQSQLTKEEVTPSTVLPVEPQQQSQIMSQPMEQQPSVDIFGQPTNKN